MFELDKRGLITLPLDTYSKGDEFKGVLFAKYPSAQGAYKVVQKFQRAQAKIGESRVWCKLDRPMEIRAQVSFLLGLRRQLIEWGLKKIKVKDDDLSMSVGGVPVLTTSVKETSLHIDWKDDTWREWTELVSSNEFKSLVETANEKLSKASTGPLKGKGKGL